MASPNTEARKKVLTAFTEEPPHKYGATEHSGASKENFHDPLSPGESGPALHWKRWLMLSIFCLFSATNSYQWFHLSVIIDRVGRYYHESLPVSPSGRMVVIEFLSLSYPICYLPFFLPVNYLLRKKGLKWYCVIGAAFNVLGCWIKCACLSTHTFPVVVLGQVLCAISQTFVLNVPVRLSAVWFPPDEWSMATSIGVMGNQIGVSLGLLLPPLIVPNTDRMEVLRNRLGMMYLVAAAISTFALLAIILFFKKAPPHPASQARMLAIEAESRDKEGYCASIRRILSNPNFALLALAYGFNVGLFYSLETLLGRIVNFYFLVSSADWVRLTFTLVAIVGAGAIGPWLDATKTFRATTSALYSLSLAGLATLSFILDADIIWVVFFVCAILGLVQSGFLPAGLELGCELTYPENEGTSSALLTAAAQLFAIISILTMRFIMDTLWGLGANVYGCGLLIIGLFLDVLIQPDYRRHGAEEMVVMQEVNEATSGDTDSEYGPSLYPHLPTTRAHDVQEKEKGSLYPKLK